MRRISLLASAVVVLFLSGCATVVSPVAPGLLGGSVKWTSLEVDAKLTNPEIIPTKTGRACAVNVLGLIAAGDASISAAKQDGGITKIAAVEHQSSSFLFFFGRYCTNVTGE